MEQSSTSRLFNVELNELNIFERYYFGITHEILKSIKLKQITFIVLLVIEGLQFMHYFLYSADKWNSIVISYMKIFLNYISFGYIMEKNQSMPSIMLGISICILLTIIIMLMIMAYRLRNIRNTKILSGQKMVVIFLSYCLVLFKNILQFPFLNIIIKSLLTLGQLETLTMKIANIIMASILIILFVILEIYIITSITDINPFSEIVFTGQTTAKGIIKLIYKIILVIFMELMNKKLLFNQFSIIAMVINFLFCIYYHYETGFFKTKIRQAGLRIQYFLFWFTFCDIFIVYTESQTTTIFIYFFLIYAILLFVLQNIENLLNNRIIKQKFIFLQSQSQIQSHILGLVNLIDKLQIRKYKILLQGYLCYHRRLCRLSQADCSCHRLINIAQRDRKNQKLEFFHLLVDMIKEAINKLTETKRLYVLLCFIYQYRQKNRFQAIRAITKTQQKPNFFDKMYFHHQINLIQNQMKEDDNKQNQNKTVDINKFFFFNNLIVDFENIIEVCATDYIEFWKEILDPNTDIKRLQLCGATITNRKDQVKIAYEKIVEINQNNVHTLLIYGNFLSEITNDESNYVKYLEKAESIMQNLKQSSKIDQSANKYTQNAETSIIVISGNEAQMGKVVHTNNFVLKMLGYKRSQLLGNNVAHIMPKIFGQHHNNVLNRYLTTSAQRFNGKERIVTALNKEGFMIPCVALTKALPNLERGVQIVGFLSVMEQKTDEQQTNRKYSYLLYRTDNEIILGISKNCYLDYGISTCLAYGNPRNSMNQLRIQHIFGFSFQKDNAAIAMINNSQLLADLNSTNLYSQFIIVPQDEAIQASLTNAQRKIVNNGVNIKVVIKNVISQVYNKVPLRLLSIYSKHCEIQQIQMSKSSIDSYQVVQEKVCQMKLQKVNSGISQNDDIKDLKDFKNFISIKREPSAIYIIRFSCLFLMVLLILSVIGLDIILIKIFTSNNKALTFLKLDLTNSLILPELLYQTQKLAINQYTDLKPTKPFEQAQIKKNVGTLIQMGKSGSISLLPIVSDLIQNSNIEAVQKYSLNALTKVTSQKIKLRNSILEIFGKYQTISKANGFQSLVIPYNTYYKLYKQCQLNTVLTFYEGIISNNQLLFSNFTDNNDLVTYFLYLTTSCYIIGVLIWMCVSIPFALSVAKINNRVLSLFSLIPRNQVGFMISKCVKYMKKFLSQANIDEENQFKEKLQLEFAFSNIEKSASPASFMTSKNNSFYNQEISSNLIIKRDEKQDVNHMKNKFEQMANSQNQDKRQILFQFISISLVLVIFVLFLHFYFFANYWNIQEQFNIHLHLGQRLIYFRELKGLLTQYLIDVNGTMNLNSTQFLNKSLMKMNQQIIENTYILERQLLDLSFASTYKNILQDYNNRNLCTSVNVYQNQGIFNKNLSEIQCLGVYGGILSKGIKTTLVKILQQSRSILALPQDQLNQQRKDLLQKLLDYEILQKYIENSVQHVLNLIREYIQSQNRLYLIIELTLTIVFIVIVIIFWRFLWKSYLQRLNEQLWRTKGMLNIIPMRIITANEVLKNQFTSGELQKAVK